MNGLDDRMKSGGLPGVVVATHLALVACGGVGEGGERHSPDPTLPRLQTLAQPAPDAGNIVDFDVAGGRLYVLEHPAGIQALDQVDGAWHASLEIGRAGSGPGELTGAMGISVVGDLMVVSHPSRVSFLTLAGELTQERSLTLPCRMLRPRASWPQSGGVYVAGACMKSGYTTDTVSAVLAWSPDTAEFTVVAEDIAYTRDGRTGSVFGASNMLTAGSGGMHGFGAGTSNCHWHVNDTGAAPVASRICPAVKTLYSADPPPELENRLRSGVRGFQIEWPATLPVFVDRLVTEHGVVLVRPFTADSVLLQLAEPDGRSLAVAPLNGFIGCRPAGCLWHLTDSVVPHIVLVEMSHIAALVAGALE